jgi:hypothetical protein
LEEPLEDEALERDEGTDVCDCGVPLDSLLPSAGGTTTLTAADDAWLAVPLVAECRLRMAGGHEEALAEEVDGLDGAKWKGEWGEPLCCDPAPPPICRYGAGEEAGFCSCCMRLHCR